MHVHMHHAPCMHMQHAPCMHVHMHCTSEEQHVEQHALAHAAARVRLDEDMVVEPPGLVRLEQPHPPVVHGLHGQVQRAAQQGPRFWCAPGGTHP